MELHRLLVDLRKQYDLSQEALAETLGVSRQTISKWESGTAHPSKRNLLRLSQVYGTTADDLLREKEAPPEPPKVSEPSKVPELQEVQKVPGPPAPVSQEPPPPAEPEREMVMRKKHLVRVFAAVILSAVIGIAVGAWVFAGDKEAADVNQESVPMDQIESEVGMPATNLIPLLPLD